MTIPLIFDTDPGIDDAIAITLALQDPELDIKLFTSVAGNVSIDKTTRNVLRLQQLYGTHIPVARGASGPLLRTVVDAAAVHGDSGMDGYDFPEPNNALLLKESAVEAMHRVLNESDQKITILAVGPQTNVALLLATYPEDKEKIEQLVIMGGAIYRGNMDVMTEFNIGGDPEAADIVFKSGLPIAMIGLEIGRQAKVSIDEAAAIKDSSIGGAMTYGMLQIYRGEDADGAWEMYDPTALAYVLHPEWFETTKYNVNVELKGSYTYGQTVVDTMRLTDREPNVEVPERIDVQAFKHWMLTQLAEGK